MALRNHMNEIFCFLDFIFLFCFLSFHFFLIIGVTLVNNIMKISCVTSVYYSVSFITRNLVSFWHHIFDPFTFFVLPRSFSPLVTAILCVSISLFFSFCLFLWYPQYFLFRLNLLFVDSPDSWQKDKAWWPSASR